MGLAPLWTFITLFAAVYLPPLTQCESSCARVKDFDSQLKTIFSMYDRGVPPPQVGPLQVGVGFTIRHIEFQDKEAMLRIIMDLTLNWQDTRLSWNVTEWNCSKTHVPTEMLWSPDVTLMNSGAISNPTSESLPAVITDSGNVTHVARIDANLPVTVDTWDWPRDLQKHTFYFGSKTMDDDEIMLIYVKRPDSIVTLSSNWDVVSEFNILLSKLATPEGMREIMSFEVGLRRMAPAHAAAAAAVFIAAILEIVAAMGLPPASRAPLCACAALTCTIWLGAVLPRLPASSARAPLCVSLSAALCAAAGAACAAAAAVCRVARLARPPPSHPRLLRLAATVCSLTPDRDTSEQSERGAWVAYSKFLDYVLTALLLLALIIIMCIYMAG